MLSIVVYGRNDSHGYNLHKRAAIGLNCLAEILDDPDDEILFVDYNTPDDFPTFPEAIADTLTDTVAARLRILRARPAIHDRVKTQTHLQVIEPIARNIAVRRSNPRNRWILSTNPDMIFVPRGSVSLSRMVETLADGFYHLPRFELPETLWEGFDRKDPSAIIDQVRRLGWTLFLNEVVYGADWIKYDAPGDFQLILRQDLFGMHGFHEGMLLGWHVDSNIAKRLYLRYGTVGDVEASLFGYHCDHTRQVTPAHGHRAASNDTGVFVERVARPEVPGQADTWGCPDDEIEEVSLVRPAHRVYVEGLRQVLKGEWTEPSRVRYVPSTFGEATYDARHVMPFLTDLFASAPRRWSVGWVGARPDTFRLFGQMWEHLGFSGEILLDGLAAARLAAVDLPPGIRTRAQPGLDDADTLVFDFGGPSRSSAQPASASSADDSALDGLMRQSFEALVRAERRRLNSGAVPRRFICVNAVHNEYQWLAASDIGAAATPYASRLRHGFVKRAVEMFATSTSDAGVAGEDPPNLMEQMGIGEGGRTAGGGVQAPFGRRGVVVEGPHTLLPAGGYRLDVSVRPCSVWSLAAAIRPILVDVLSGDDLLVRHRARFFRGGTVSVRFDVSEAAARRRPFCFRVFRGRFVEFIVTGVRLTRLSQGLRSGATGDVWTDRAETAGTATLRA